MKLLMWSLSLIFSLFFKSPSWVFSLVCADCWMDLIKYIQIRNSCSGKTYSFPAEEASVSKSWFQFLSCVFLCLPQCLEVSQVFEHLLVEPLAKEGRPWQSFGHNVDISDFWPIFHKEEMGKEDESTHSFFSEVNCSLLGEAFVFKGFVAQPRPVDGDEGVSQPDGCVHCVPQHQPLLWPGV